MAKLDAGYVGGMSDTAIDDPHPGDERRQQVEALEALEAVEGAVDAGGVRVDDDEVEGPNPA
jgi:hypothetical protein